MESVHLRDGGSIIARSKTHLAALIVPIVVVVIGVVMLLMLDPFADLWQFLARVLIALGIWQTVEAIALRRTTSIVLTDERLIAETGPYRRKKLDVVIKHVDRVIVKRGPLARLLGYGTLVITARGAQNQKLQYRQIANPDALAEQIRAQAFAPAKPANLSSNG